MSRFNGNNSLKVYRQSFISKEGQASFNLNSTYEINKNKISVIVGGVPQFSPENFTETSNGSFTLSEGLPAGIPVEVELLQ